jgi:hypothetical protein
MSKGDDLLAAVTAEDTLVDGVILVLNAGKADLATVRAQLAQAGLDLTAIDSAIALSNTSAQKLTDALAANVP